MLQIGTWHWHFKEKWRRKRVGRGEQNKLKNTLMHIYSLCDKAFPYHFCWWQGIIKKVKYHFRTDTYHWTDRALQTFATLELIDQFRPIFLRNSGFRFLFGLLVLWTLHTKCTTPTRILQANLHTSSTGYARLPSQTKILSTLDKLQQITANIQFKNSTHFTFENTYFSYT